MPEAGAVSSHRWASGALLLGGYVPLFPAAAVEANGSITELASRWEARFLAVTCSFVWERFHQLWGFTWVRILLLKISSGESIHA